LSQADVTVIGGGLAGMAASLHLAKAGLKVLCIEPEAEITKVVGESLDWSAPELLSALGLPMERLVRDGVATYKRHVTVKLGDGCDRYYVPSNWVARPPFNVELRTMHVDRLKLHEVLHAIVVTSGVQIVRDKVVKVETDGTRISAVTTVQGAQASSPWFIDASGAGARLFARAFNLPVREYGPKKVAMWTYFDVSESSEGTTLYAHGVKPTYMEWVWEIPIRTNAISVGYVATADAIKGKRQKGLSVEEILRRQLGHFPRFDNLLQGTPLAPPWVTTYQCFVHGRAAGSNWLIAGEAAAMVDPMTSNGVTAALRHAEEAACLIQKYRDQREIPRIAAAMYSRRVSDVGRFFNSGIENVVYDWPIRNRIGVLNAGDVYTVPAWSLNNVYSRIRPKGVISTVLFGSLLNLVRMCGEIYNRFSKWMVGSRKVAA
jgi:menaquinone-9 beta-reductase